MKIVLSWLNELTPVGEDVEAIDALFNDLGLAVDGVERVGVSVPGVVVARVIETARHPDAEKVQRVWVDRGDGERLHVWCGAFNFAPGDLVPLATVGTTMPNGMEIGRRKILGEASNGMLCSTVELGLGDDAAGIFVLPPDLPVGHDLFTALGITDDVVFDLDIPRNRPDCWSHLGVARDVAARLGLPFTPPVADVAVEGDSPIGVEILDTDLCGRFTARVVSGVQVGPSPRWLADRLTRAGMRPINNVVDVSNYVMLELGRPNHTYDLAKLAGQGFRIRRARPGETLVTLDGVERTLGPDDCLICDGHDVAIGIGGIMGGASTEIDDASPSVALEMAWFDPVAISVTSARLGLRSEASARFERGADWDDMDLAGRRFVELLRLTCPEARLHRLVDGRGQVPDRTPVTVRVARVNRMLGTELTAADIKGYLDPIGFTAVPAQHEEDVLSVALPTWRFDTTSEIDVIEEVARHHGYSRIARTVPTSAHPGGLSAYQRERRLVREVLVGLGATEAMPNAFLAPGDLERAGLDTEGISLTNPLVTEESVLRPSMLPGLLKAVALNESHRCSEVSLFEVAHVYRRPPAGQVLPDEREFLSVALAGRDAFEARRFWDELAAALAVDGVRVVAGERPGLHPTRTALLVGPDDTDIGALGEVDPGVLGQFGVDERVAWLEVDLEALHRVPHGERRFVPFSRMPSSDIDLAFVVTDDVPAADVESTLRAAGRPLLVDLRLFDVYRGPGVGAGARSLAFALRLQAFDRTLTDADVAEVRTRCIAAVESAHGARLR